MAAGRDLTAIYRDVSARPRPKYGRWVIFDHCLPFDVSRAYDEPTRLCSPHTWPAERDRQMWSALQS